MQKEIRGILLDVVKQEATIKTIQYDDEEKNYLDAYYNILNCDTFDIVNRKFGSHSLDVYLDDEGALIEDNVPSVITIHQKEVIEVLYGNVFICNQCNGETISLTDDEIVSVMACIKTITIKETGKNITILISHI